MGTKKDNAIGLYMEGIRDGNAREAITKYTGARYTQHSTGVADGPDGFVAFFEPFLARNPKRDIQVIRALEDGQHVFVHVYQNLNDGEAEWVTTDFFDTDPEDRIVEHWDVIAAYEPKTASGRTSVDGDCEVRDRELTEANRQTVQRLIDEFLIPGGKTDPLREYVTEDLSQHDSTVPDGIAAYAAYAVSDGRRLKYEQAVLTVAEGNFVATLCKAKLDGEPVAQVDVYRLDAGKVVERWSNLEPVPPREAWANSGKF
ncbi:MAG: nuclear transport factor 2 family protein [Myxococcota bacterium]